MNTELIFKAYSEEFGMLDIIEIDFNDKFIRSTDNIDLLFKNIKVLQYTGQIDDYDKKIFCGDIIGGNYDGYVEWCMDECCGGAWSLYFPNYGCLSVEQRDDFTWKDIALREHGEVKVIGNIFENSDYLKEKHTRFKKQAWLK